MDIEFAREVLNHISKHPLQHCQLTWGMRQNAWGIGEYCGTSACLAGTAVLLDPTVTPVWTDCTDTIAQYMKGVQLNDDPDNMMDVEDWAAQRLGLDPEMAHKLFHCRESAHARNFLAALIAQAEVAQQLENLKALAPA